LALKEGTEVDLTLTTPPGEDDPLAGVIGIGNTPSANDLRLRSSVRLGVRR
jgi:hypothetical protein